jgi:hypothetical protein
MSFIYPIKYLKKCPVLEKNSARLRDRIRKNELLPTTHSRKNMRALFLRIQEISDRSLDVAEHSSSIERTLSEHAEGNFHLRSEFDPDTLRGQIAPIVQIPDLLPCLLCNPG